MKKLTVTTLGLAAALCVGAANLKDLKIYVNPGHGGHDSDDRNVAVPPFKQGDPEGYWESNSNLVKGLDLRDMLQKFGARVMMSRTTNTTADDRGLHEIGYEANAYGADFFFSIHSNATGTSSRVNQPLMLYRGFTNDPVSPEAKEMSLILNKQLLEKAGYKAEDINSFDKLKACADDIQARKDELGVDGAFTSAGMDDSSSWRYTTHLANLPLYYEFEKEHNQEDDEIKGEYLDNFKQIFDLYITDSTCDPSQLASKTGDDATNEFATGKAVFYQNGSWAYSDLIKAGMTDDQLGMMPIYIGVDGEENQGLCSGGENYWCVSSQASEDAQKATEDFMYWCVTSDTATSIIADKMGLTAPFKSAKETTNVFSQQAVAMAKDGKKTVAWDFVYIPSEEWKKNLKQALIAYAADNSKWDGVKNAFVDGWKTEKAASE